MIYYKKLKNNMLFIELKLLLHILLMSKKEDYVTVAELSDTIKNLLSTSISSQKVKGEISNMKISGKNIYFTLKDNTASISVVCWNGVDDKKYKEIHNGDDVFVYGKINCFQKQGTYQLTAYKVDRIGMGDIHEKYEVLKKTFERNGYFSKKRELPTKINRIGILTATEGAALQDVLYVLNSNNFYGEIYVKNCAVQGANCPLSVAEGIKYFNELNKNIPFDILLITRGGGSFEDLIGYSSSEVVRAIHESDIITISAVGHEVDCMLSDLAADYRAPTPSVAGEIITTYQKKKQDKLKKIIEKIEKKTMILENNLDNIYDKILTCNKLLETINPEYRIKNEKNKLEMYKTSLNSKYDTQFYILTDKLKKLKYNVDQYNMNKNFTNGFSMIVDRHYNIIDDVDVFKKYIADKKHITIIFKNGSYDL